MRLLGFLLLDLALADLAFLAPPVSRAPSGGLAAFGRRGGERGLLSPVARDAEIPVPPKQAASTGLNAALLLGVSAVAMALARRRANLARRVWTYMPMDAAGRQSSPCFPCASSIVSAVSDGDQPGVDVV
ncbi:unnamed protein product [Symbiodinium natans]|uniref:Uncharacterized protein n=1 Tax=Symbiodinium natans TaxID=878477 RepID=A0A812IEI9_9DINO|nr:unnamed protein product [Symbiodinium natans]